MTTDQRSKTLDPDDFFDDDSPIHTAIAAIEAYGAQVAVFDYRGDECSCCYYPEWDNTTRVLIPYNEADNQSDSRASLWSGYSGTPRQSVFINYETAEGSADEMLVLGHTVARAFTDAGYLVAWDGTPHKSIQLLPVAPGSTLIYAAEKEATQS